MSTSVKVPGLAPEIAGLISNLRRRIRWQIVWDGLLASLIWLGLTFWIGLALDYFPVLMWANELPYAIRLVGLTVIAGVLAYILYRFLLRRLLVPLRDNSMALLIERQYGEFEDGLITTVESPEVVGANSQEMLTTTRQQAVATSGNVRIGKLLQRRSLWKKTFWAAALLLPIGGFYAANADAFETWVRRMYLLEDRPWPRTAKITMLGLQVERVSPRTGEVSFGPLREFDEETNSLKVALGSNLQIRVAASTQAEKIPDYCRLLYRLDDGTRGQVRIRKDGSVDEANNRQDYMYRGRPFLTVLGDIEFDVIGYDHRIRQFKIEAVESPVITETILERVFPDYMVDEKSGQFLPSEIPYRSSGVQIPAGTKVKVRMKANKPLTRVVVFDTQQEKESTIELGGVEEFVFEIDELLTSQTIEFTLHDTDEITSERPHRLFIGVVEDVPPEVNVVVQGIGNAITPYARLPIQGAIKDEYGVAETWFEYKRDGETFKTAFAHDGETIAENTALDFRDLRADDPPYELKPGQQITVQIKASDKMNISGGPNIGKNDVLPLEIVSPDELIAILERREYVQRRTYEHILDELTQTRDTLVRLRESLAGRDDDVLDSSPDDFTEEQQEARKQALSVLRAQQSLRQSEKSRQETIAIAESFYLLREELVNNRVDAKDRQQRLKDRIADPLIAISETRFPELDAQLEKLLEDLAEKREATSEEAVEASNLLLADMNAVLESMLDIESYNELIEIVRSLIEDQEDVIEETRKQRRKSALDLVE
jgi:hypothetical protein